MASRPRPVRPYRPRPPTPLPLAAAVRPTLVALLLLVVVLGVGYSGLGTEAAHATVPGSAGGSLRHDPNGTAYGSALLGQNLTGPAEFWPRPSLIDYAAFAGAGGEVPYGPTDPALYNATLYYLELYGVGNVSVPLDLVSPSASGLDPDIVPAAALLQVPRVALYSNHTEAWLTDLVTAHIEGPALGLFGPRFVNVLALDVALAAAPPGA